MSGYAWPPPRSAPTVTGSDRARRRRRSTRLRARASTVAVGHDAANVPAGDDVEVVVLDRRSRRTTPSASRPRARAARAAPRATLLGRAHRAQAHASRWPARTARRRRRSMIAHALLGARAASPATSSAASCGRRARTRTGARGEWLVVEADESDRSLLRAGRRDRRGARTSSSTTTRPTARGRSSTRPSARSSPAAGTRSSGTAPSCARWPAARGRSASRPATCVRRRALRAGAASRSCCVPGDHNARNAAAALEACALAGRRTRPRPSRRWRRSRAPGGASSGLGRDRRGRERRRRLRPPPDRGRRDDRRGAHAGAAARRRGLPAPPLLAHARARAGVRRRAGRRPTSPSSLDVYPARERAEDFPGVERPDSSPRRPPTPPAGARCCGCRLRRRRARAARRACARATSAWSWGPATSTCSDARLVEGRPRPRQPGRRNPGGRRSPRRDGRAAPSRSAARRHAPAAAGAATSRRPRRPARGHRRRRRSPSWSGGWLWLRDSSLVARPARSR